MSTSTNIKDSSDNINWLEKSAEKGVEHRSNRCHCRKICLEFFWQIENYPGKLG